MASGPNCWSLFKIDIVAIILCCHFESRNAIAYSHSVSRIIFRFGSRTRDKNVFTRMWWMISQFFPSKHRRQFRENSILNIFLRKRTFRMTRGKYDEDSLWFRFYVILMNRNSRKCLLTTSALDIKFHCTFLFRLTLRTINPTDCVPQMNELTISQLMNGPTYLSKEYELWVCCTCTHPYFKYFFPNIFPHAITRIILLKQLYQLKVQEYSDRYLLRNDRLSSIDWCQESIRRQKLSSRYKFLRIHSDT